MSTRHSRGPIWTQPEPGQRRPRLNRDQIAAAALRIADHEGFEALSMRRLAEVLDAGTMTLYHYVRTKDDLIALLDDAVMAEVLIPDGQMPAHWRPALELLARHSYGAFARHPWALQALQSARFGPNGLRHFEQSLAAVAGTGLALRDRMTILSVVDDFVFGHAFRSNDDRTRAARDPRELRAVLDFTTTQLATGHYPHIAATLEGLSPEQAWRKMATLIDDAGRFEAGLQAMLDGIALHYRLPQLPGAAGPASRRSGRPAPPRARRRRGS